MIEGSQAAVQSSPANNAASFLTLNTAYAHAGGAAPRGRANAAGGGSRGGSNVRRRQDWDDGYDSSDDDNDDDGYRRASRRGRGNSSNTRGR